MTEAALYELAGNWSSLLSMGSESLTAMEGLHHAAIVQQAQPWIPNPNRLRFVDYFKPEVFVPWLYFLGAMFIFSLSFANQQYFNQSYRGTDVTRIVYAQWIELENLLGTVNYWRASNSVGELSGMIIWGMAALFQYQANRSRSIAKIERNIEFWLERLPLYSMIAVLIQTLFFTAAVGLAGEVKRTADYTDAEKLSASALQWKIVKDFFTQQIIRLYVASVLYSHQKLWLRDQFDTLNELRWLDYYEEERANDPGRPKKESDVSDFEADTANEPVTSNLVSYAF